MDEQLEQIEALNALESLVKPVLAYQQKLLIKPQESQSDQEKLWLLAYQAVDNKFAQKTEAGMMEAVELLPILIENIPDSI